MMSIKNLIKILSVIHLILFVHVSGQNVGIGTATPNTTLDIASTTQGILIPRMTAQQAETITSPRLGELICVTTNNGNIINKIGFWYYDGSIWRPFGGGLQPNINIYNNDGTLTSNRTVTMNGRSLSFDADKLSIHSTEQRIGIGIGNSTPAYTTDVSGDVRVRNLTGGNVKALPDGTLSIGPKVAYGTVKESLRTADHNGWYKLDGRAISTLPAIAQTNASTIGLSGTLVDTNNRLMRQGAPFITGGSGTTSLVRANLPNINLTGVTSTAAAHSHTATAGGYSMYPVAAGNAYVVRSGRGTASGTHIVTLPAAGAHSHTGTVNSGGNGTPVSVIPQNLAYSYFIYLGQ
ncbi:hypothetical protein A0O34_21260 [Chryseobacterium glaciei]|uniref:Phage tail collar domain-containing protein n=1 Tax=Chryseobacterium glaciei TaxID=1685010 RepID=A0A172Y100_9FLAO|nr:hypothetical protein [Chryseobacterium glaciei]ANF52894.1 hypothetical protein A0O34_21260 [Chryseobacterium glaciei]